MSRQPPVSLEKVLKRRDRLITEAHRAGWPDVSRRQLTEFWTKLIGSAAYSAVYQSVSWVDVAIKDDNKLKELAWAIAGNTKSLKLGKPVVPFSWLTSNNPVPVLTESANVVSGFNNVGNRGLLKLRVVAGPGCPGTVNYSVSEKAAVMLAYHPKYGLGFDRSEKLIYVHPRQFYGLRANAIITPQEGSPKVVKLWGTASGRKHNRELLLKRVRKGFNCPFEYKHACHLCPKGQVSCPAATHKVDWVALNCKCGNKAWSDPDFKPTVCVSCSRR